MVDLTSLFAQSRDVGFVTDARGAILSATSGAMEALGYAASEFVGLDLPHLSEGGLDGFFGGRGPVESRMNLSLLVRAKSGRTVALNAVALPLVPAGGELLGWFIVGRPMRGTLSETRGVPSVVGALVDSIGAALWAFDPGGSIVVWSRACEGYFGYPRGEAEETLRAVRLFPSPGEFRRVVEIVERDGRFSGEVALVARDGTTRPNHVTVTRFDAGDGTAIGYTCVSFDVSERRRLEEIQRALFEQTAEAIVVSDPETRRFLDANEMACRLHGYPREEFLRLNIRDLLPPDYDPGRLAAIYRELDETGRFYGEQEIHRRKDGTLFPCSLNVRRFAVGGKRFSVAVVRDLSEQQRVEGELKRSREDLETRVRERTGEVYRQTKAMDAASEGIAIVAPGGTFLYMNAAHAQIYGHERPEGLLGTSWRPFYDERQLEEFDRVILPAVLKEGRWRGAVTGRRKDGTSFPEELSLALLEDGALVCVVKDITDRERAEQELRASEARFRTMSQASPLGIFLAGPDGGVTYSNPAALRISGLADEAARGTGWLRAVHPEDRERVRGGVEDGLRSRASFEVVYRFLRGDGTVVWANVKAASMTDSGKFLGYVGMIEDITERVRAEEELRASRDQLEQRVEGRTAELKAEVVERRRAEEALRESEERIRALVESAQDFIQTVDREGRILSINRVLPQFRMEDVIGSSAYGYLPEEHAKVMRAVLERVFESGQHGQYETSGPGPEGRTSWYASRVSPIFRDGRVVAATIIATDVTSRREAEEALRFQKTLLEAQGEAAIDGILVVDAEGKMISFNRRFVEMWGIPEEIVASRSDEAAIRFVLLKLVDAEGFVSRVRHLYAHRDEESRDELLLKDGRVFDRHSAPVKSADGTCHGRVWFFRDVTERRRALAETRRAYEDLKQAQAQLIRSEKLASIGMLVSGVAHEINNPLNVMYGNLKLLAQACEMLTPLAVEGARARKVRGVVGRARRFKAMIRDGIKAAEQARRVIEDFRHFARDARSAELVDLNVCLQESLAILQRDLGTRVRVVRRLGAVPPVRCFRGQMNQVFLNLIKNASEAIEDRGTITLRTFRRGRRVVVEVADTGRGMDEEVRKKLFEPFFTTKPMGKGLGLGLSISATIVQNHGGQITVRSRPRKGTVFQVALPIES